MRIATDGYIDLTDRRYVRTPGAHTEEFEALPEREALDFLLSHDFPGHRRVVRPLNVEERKRIGLARWADSVSERMGIVDRVWRAITVPVPPPADLDQPQLIQILTFRDRTYPLFLEGGRTRVIGNAEIDGNRLPRSMVMDFDLKTA
jgi:hypothetical protein